MENIPNYISLSKAFKGSTVFNQKGKKKKKKQRGERERRLLSTLAHGSSQLAARPTSPSLHSSSPQPVWSTILASPC